jgi:hypothetical protein
MWAATLVAVVGILATLVGGDWLHDELFVEVPFYRTLWLWTVLVNALAGLLLWRTRDERPHVRAALAIGVGIYALDAWVPFEMPFIAMPVLATVLIATRRRPSGEELASTDKLALFSISLVATLLAVTFLVYRLGGDALRSTEFDYPLLDFFYLLVALSAAGLAFRGFRKTAMGVLAATIVAQVATYDQRFGPHIEDSPPKLPQTVAALVGRSTNVYWEDGVYEQWLALRRPAYFSCIQGAGVAFHKRTALEYHRREMGLRRLNTDDFADSRVMSPCPIKASNSAVGQTSRAQLASACRALPDLDLMVLYARIPGAYSAEWPLPRTVYLGNPRRMFDHDYLYECRTLR